MGTIHFIIFLLLTSLNFHFTSALFFCLIIWFFSPFNVRVILRPLPCCPHFCLTFPCTRYPHLRPNFPCTWLFFLWNQFIAVFVKLFAREILSQVPANAGGRDSNCCVISAPRSNTAQRYNPTDSTLQSIMWGKFSQKHNCTYMAKRWCLLAIENYMFRPVAAIIRFWQLSCYKSYL